MISFVKILVVAPGKEPEVRVVQNDHYRYHQQVVGGELDVLRLTNEGEHGQDGLVVIRNADATGIGLPVNRIVDEDVIRGMFFFTRMQDGDNIDLTEEDIEICKQLVEPYRGKA